MMINLQMTGRSAGSATTALCEHEPEPLSEALAGLVILRKRMYYLNARGAGPHDATETSNTAGRLM
jgi:hypothetical protein